MNNPWTWREDVFILKNYKKMTSWQMAKKIKRSPQSIGSRVSQLNNSYQEDVFKKWFDEYAPNLQPEYAIKSLEIMGIKTPDKFYRDWRKEYLKERNYISRLSL